MSGMTFLRRTRGIIEFMSFEIKRATRVGINPLIGIYAESGCGKTYSALLLARGMAGPSGKIVVADSESRRASLYADIIPGGFDTFDLCQPFSPERYVNAVEAIESSGAAVGIIDSGSHEWDGPGSVLDMATEIEAKSGKPGLHCWRQPKFEHAKFVARLLRANIPFIICLRAKYKSRQIKDENKKTIIVKDEATSPIQAEEFIFEMTAHAEILQNHTIILTKCSHPALRSCFPADKTEPLAIKHGEALAAWCANPSAASAKATKDAPAAVLTPKAATPTAVTRNWMVEELLKRFDEQFLLSYAIDKGIIMPNEGLCDWPLGRVVSTRGGLAGLIDDINKEVQR